MMQRRTATLGYSRRLLVSAFSSHLVDAFFVFVFLTRARGGTRAEQLYSPKICLCNGEPAVRACFCPLLHPPLLPPSSPFPLSPPPLQPPYPSNPDVKVTRLILGPLYSRQGRTSHTSPRICRGAFPETSSLARPMGVYGTCDVIAGELFFR